MPALIHDRRRRWARNAVAAAVSLPGVSAGLRTQLRSQAVVFMFHRVLPQAEFSDYFDPERVVTAETFARLIPFLRRWFEIVPLEEVASEPARHPRCALTFDDGWEDNARCAWPILRAANAPATIFLVNRYLDRDRLLWPDAFFRLTAGLQEEEAAELRRQLTRLHPWLQDGPDPFLLASVRRCLNCFSMRERSERGEALTADLQRLRLPAAGRLPARAFLHVGEVESLRQQGCAFGAHTMTHPALTELTDAELETELAGGRQALAAGCGVNARALSYPYGNYDLRVVRFVAAAGFQSAVTSHPRATWPGGDPLQIPRVGLSESMLAHHPGRFRPALLQAHLQTMLWRTRHEPPPPTVVRCPA